MPDVGNQPQARREDDDQRHPDHEIRHRIQDQAEPVPEPVREAAAVPAGPGADRQTDDDRDDLAQADEQDDVGQNRWPMTSVTGVPRKKNE